MKRKTTYTPHQAASETRKQIIRKIRRMQTGMFIDRGGKEHQKKVSAMISGDRLIAWIRQQDERAAKKEGGL